MIIKIDHTDVRVESMTDNGEDRGTFCGHTQIIEIECTQSAHNQADTLLHEIIHAIWSSRSLPKRISEEQAATFLGSALATVFRDNPELLARLKAALISGIPIVGVTA